MPSITCFNKVSSVIHTGEHLQNEDFAKVSPSKTVPAIDDNGFALSESAAIMTYLVDKYSLPDHWYPRDPKRRARVDEYMHWHHGNLRYVARLFFPKVTVLVSFYIHFLI